MSAFDEYVHHYLGLFKIDASACLRRIVLVPTLRVRTHYQLAWHHCPPLYDQEHLRARKHCVCKFRLREYDVVSALVACTGRGLGSRIASCDPSGGQEDARARGHACRKVLVRYGRGRIQFEGLVKDSVVHLLQQHIQYNTRTRAHAHMQS